MKIKAIALISGGLDSTLAVKLIKEQGIEIIALNFKTPFCLCDKKTSDGCANQARDVANKFGVELKTINVADEFFKIIENPKHGYGSNMNPCIDCRILMFKKAKEFMQQTKAAFIVTGEVLGQRPMSQHKQALKIIERESGLEGLVLRPLSAQLLPPTIPEKEGWVDRNRLLDFQGRSRRPQMDLANDFNIQDYPCSAGGCLLTDPLFAKRLKDLLRHEELNLNNVELLKVGRHFRLSEEAKLVVGRDEGENERLINLAQENDYLFLPNDELAGPTSLGRGTFNEELITLSCRITCRYCDLNGHATAKIIYRQGKEERVIEISPLEETQLRGLRL